MKEKKVESYEWVLNEGHKFKPRSEQNIKGEKKKPLKEITKGVFVFERDFIEHLKFTAFKYEKEIKSLYDSKEVI